jgi:hypothetical protein
LCLPTGFAATGIDGIRERFAPYIGMSKVWQFRDEPRSRRRIWTYPREPAVLSLLSLALIASLALAMSGLFAYVVLFSSPLPFGGLYWDLMGLLALALSSSFVIALTHYLARDVIGKWRGHIALTSAHLELDLAAHRSLIHEPPRLQAAVPYAHITCVETRLEGYRSFGLAMIQRSYRLRRRFGEPILLFEQRALGTNIQTASLDALAREIATSAKAPIDDLGMVEGKAGIFAMLGAQEVPWSTPSLPASSQRAIWNRAISTGALPSCIFIAAIVIKSIIAMA